MTGTRLTGTIWNDSVGWLINVASSFLHRRGFGVDTLTNQRRRSLKKTVSATSYFKFIYDLFPRLRRVAQSHIHWHYPPKLSIAISLTV